MTIRVLGSVDVELNGHPVKLGGPKQQAVLAMLALKANETVSIERLIDGLWGEEPPPTAAKMVQQYVSQLRRLTSSNGSGPEILTHGRGYELRIDPAAVDALRFEELVEQRSARAALALWQGRPLPGMDEEPFAASEIRRLEELHLIAVEQTIEADLEAGRHAEVVGRLAALADEHPLRERLRSLQMLALYRSGRQAEALDVFRDTRYTLTETLGIEPGPELRRLQEAILRQDPALDRVVPDEAWASRETAEQVGAEAQRASRQRGELRASERELADRVIDLQALRGRSPGRAASCPFKGLESFDVADAENFFGRERLVADMVASLPGASLIGVVGPSGSGKSSAVRAGLLPALAAGVLPGSENWAHAVMRPGERPLDALRRARASDVLVVDQFEEVFTACRDEEQRGAFIDAVVGDTDRSLVVIALRADFYGPCSAYPRLARLLGRNQVLVGPMRADELERAIEGPAARAGLVVEPELVARLVEETSGRPGGLPLLSTTLRELWQQRDRDRLTLRAYDRTGGVQGAVARLAETAYASLDRTEAAVARNMVLRLAGAEGNEALVRRQVPLAEFDLASSEPARRVLTVLTESRLVTVDQNTVEVAHEALLHEWPRVRTWLEQDAEARRLHRQITLAAQDWEADGRDASELYRGARLASAMDFAAEHSDELNELEREFLDEARLVSERDALRSRRINRRLRTLLAAALAAFLLAGVAAIIALDQRGTARGAALVADAQRIGAQALTDDRLDRALLLARTGVALNDTVATRGNLLSTLQRVQPGSLGTLPEARDVEIYTVALSPHGDRIAVGDAFGEIRIFDRATRTLLTKYRLRPGLVQRIAFSPDGRRLAVASLKPDDGSTVLDLFDANSLRPLKRIPLPQAPGAKDFTGASPLFAGNSRNLVVLETPFPKGTQVLRRVDAESGRLVGRPVAVHGTALDPVMSGDGRRVFVTSEQENATYEIDTADLHVIRRYGVGGVAVALHPNDETLAIAGSDGTIRTVDPLSAGAERLRGRHPGGVLRMRFAPGQNLLVAIGGSGKLTVWNLDTGAVARRFNGHSEEAEGLAITPDGRTAISTGNDGRIALWDLTEGRQLTQSVPLRKRFVVDDFTPRGIAVSPDDGTLAATQSDGSVDLIDARTLRPRRSLPAADGAALGADFSPDGRLLAVTGEHGRVSLWDAHAPVELARLHGLRGWVQAVAFSPDGRLLAAADANGERAARLRIWDVRRRTLTRFRANLMAGSLAFSPDGRLIAGSANEFGTQVRDVRTGRLVAKPQSGELARSVAFSPDGRLLFIGMFDGSGQFYSTHDWRPVGPPIRGQGQRLLNARFTPDGRTLATTSADGTALLWDVASRKPIGKPLMVQPNVFVAGAISHDGAHLFALPTGTSGVRLALSPEAWKRQACEIAGRELTAHEWSDALPGRDYRKVCA